MAIKSGNDHAFTRESLYGIKSENTFAVVFGVVLEAIILIYFMGKLERRMAPWAHDVSV